MASDKELIAKLETTLNKVAEPLKKTAAKKMFGCHALFANTNVFALVWKHGRIGVKLTNENDYQKLMATKGSEPWTAGPMKMKHWVLVPEAYHNKLGSLEPWVKLAHEQALHAEPKAAKAPSKKAPAQKTSKAKAVTKKKVRK